MADYRIIDLTLENIPRYGLFCISNPKHEGYIAKLAWLKKRFAEGLRFKMMIDKKDKPVGFIEYTPGEYNWRALEAPNYMVIHCIMVYPKKEAGKGHGTKLVQACIEDAKQSKMLGVAVLTSDGTWVPDSRLFESLGFKSVSESGRFQLMVCKLKRGPLPKFKNWEAQLAKTKGWQLACSYQCPYNAKAMLEIPPEAETAEVNLKLREFKTAKQAQNSASPFGTFALTRDGKLLSDHCISKTRFKNIVKKELSR